MKPSLIIAIGIIVILLVGFLVLYSRLPQSPPPTLSGGVPIPSWGISIGNPSANTILIELFDLHCPYCAQAHEQLDPLYKQLVDEGKLRVVFLDLVVHPEALPAHQLLHCAYRELGNATLDLINEAYMTFMRNGADAQLELLQRYKCGNVPTKTEMDNAVRTLLNWLGERGFTVRGLGTPTFIVIKNGTVTGVVVGADVAKVMSLLVSGRGN